MKRYRFKTGKTNPASVLLRLGTATLLTLGAPLILPIMAPDAAPRALAQGRAIAVYINEQPLQFGSARPARIGGRVLVPMRAIFEALGAQVQWDAATQGITASRGSAVVQMQIGNRNATINGQAVNLDQPPLLYAGSTMVPLRFVGEAMGAEVRWSDVQNAVFITDPLAGGSSAQPLPSPVTPPVGTPPVGTSPIGTPPVGTSPIGIPPVGTPPIGTTPIISPPTPQPVTPPVTAPVVPQGGVVQGTIVKVDPVSPMTLTLRVKDESGAPRLMVFNVSDDARQSHRATAFVPAAGATPNYSQPMRTGIGTLAPGEEIRAQIGPNGIVTNITANTLLAPARVRAVQGNQVWLEGYTTPLKSGDPAQGGVRFWGANNRAMPTPNLRPGDNVALFIAPSTMTIFQVSARDADIQSAGGQPNLATGPGYQPGTTDPLTGTLPGTQPITPGGLLGGTQPGTLPGTTTEPPPGAPRIQSVTHNGTKPLRAGQPVLITVRANTGLRGLFTLSPRMAPQPLIERPDRPGSYQATYTVKAGDDVLNGRVTVTMIGQNNAQDVEQSQTPITIDTVPPRVTGIFPANGAQTNNTMPNIAVYADDIGGSGLARGTIRLTPASGVPLEVPAVVVLGGISGETPRALTGGQVNVRASVADAAGNETPIISTFTVMGAAAGGLSAVTHNARTAMRSGDVIVAELRGDAGGRATFDLVGDNNRLVAVNLPMREIEPGRYQGTYAVQGTEATTKLRVVGRLLGANNQVVTNEATTQVSLAAATPEPAAFSITAPADKAQVASPLTVRGRGLPGAIIDVALRAQGTQVTRLLLWEQKREFTQELGTQQVQVNNNGVWVTKAIELPEAKDVEDLKFVITATQTDSLNRKSQPATVTVTPKP